MKAYKIEDLLESHDFSTQRYLEFLRVPALSMGVYQLPAGGDDPQQPHSEDEVYYVVSGKAMIQVGETHQSVEPGTLVYVSALVPHRFYDIEEQLTVLVFFAPPEGTANS